MADFVSGLNSNTPVYNDPVSEAASQVRGIKKALKGTFPLFVDALDVGPTAINTYEGRIAALEAAFIGALAPREIQSGIIDLGGAGTYATSGLGFAPSLLVLTASTRGTISGIRIATGSYGFGDGTNQHCVGVASDFRAGNDTAITSNTLLWNLYAAQGAAAPNDVGSQGTLASLDADGFTLNQTVANVSETRLLWTAFQ